MIDIDIQTDDEGGSENSREKLRVNLCASNHRLTGRGDSLICYTITSIVPWPVNCERTIPSWNKNKDYSTDSALLSRRRNMRLKPVEKLYSHTHISFLAKPSYALHLSHCHPVITFLNARAWRKKTTSVKFSLFDGRRSFQARSSKATRQLIINRPVTIRIHKLARCRLLRQSP